MRGAHDYAEHLELRTCPWLEEERVRYIDSINPIGVFVDECCDRDPSGQEYCASLFEAHKVWCVLNGERYKSIRWFGSQMTMLLGGSRSLRIEKGPCAKAYTGVRILSATVGA